MSDDASSNTAKGEEQAAAPASPVASSQRLASLDFIRGVAVLGILFANIVAFGHPQLAYSWPGALPDALAPADKAVWLAQYLLIDGKMRGLFTLLFGAGMALFADRAAARGSGDWLQLRRLIWLLIFGLAHFYLLFWGDILFLYALSGLAVLPLLRTPARGLLALGTIWYLTGALVLALLHSPAMKVEQGYAAPAAIEAARPLHRSFWQERQERAAAEARLFGQGDYSAELSFTAGQAEQRLGQAPFIALTETIPLMLIGMALLRLGFFSGAPRPSPNPGAMRRWGWAGIALGTALSLPLGLWAMARDFPPFLTDFAVSGAPQALRLPVIVGMAALLAAWAPAATQGWLGARFAAAGRMAFSNYIGTSILMMLVFRSWAGGYYGELSRTELLVPVLGGWLAMLAWSQPWLKRFRYGPLEWLWRCLTYGRLFPLLR